MKLILKKAALIIALLMIFSSVTGLLTSCKKTEENHEDPTDVSDSTVNDKEDINYKEYLPTATFDGADVKLFLMATRRDQFFTDEGDSYTNVVNQKIVERNSYIETTYDVYLDYEQTNDGWRGFHDQCQRDLWAGTANFDIIVPDYYYTCETSGYFLNLLDYDVIKFDNPYWVSGWNDNVTINNKIYTAVSYYTLDPVNKAEVLYINNYLAEDCGVDVEAIQESIWEGTWTLEEMKLAMAKASNDEDGSGEWSFKDSYGLAYNIWGGRAMLFSAGLELSQYDPNSGEVIWKYDKQSNVDIFQKMYAFFNNNTMSYYGGGGGMAELPDSDRNLFFQGRALFATNSLEFSSQVSAHLDSYTVLPMPKYDTNQEDYVTTLLGSCVFGIMKTAKDPVMSATILEAMSILTYEDIVPVQYEEVLKIRYQTDANVGAMIDMITEKITMDFAFINSSNFEEIGTKPFDLIVAYDRNFVSGMRKISGTLDAKMETFLAAYSDTPTASAPDLTE